MSNADAGSFQLKITIPKPVVWCVGCFLLFAIYSFGIWNNPPGYYVDESALSYNAYLVAQTGAGEFGSKFPLYFQVYTGRFTQWANPTQIYLLAVLFKIFGPGIVTARIFATAWVFAACLLLGLLARRISGRTAIGVIVAGAALATPWLFEVGRLVLELFIYPIATVFLLWSVYAASEKKKWSWLNVAAIVGSLTLLTYSYTIGRLLGPLLAAGLVVFAVNRERIISVAKVWAAYALAILPLIVYIKQNPELTTRFYLLSYIKPESSWIQIAWNFLNRYLQDLNPLTMLLQGDVNPRHHIQDALGSFYVAVFILAVIGIVVVVVRHRRDSWWLYVLFALFASAVPGALTVDKFHTLRMIAYPVFLLVLTVPALRFLLGGPDRKVSTSLNKLGGDEGAAGDWHRAVGWKTSRGMLLAAIVIVGSAEAAYFHWNCYRSGSNRGYVFDTAYRTLYDHAVNQPQRPVFLVDGYWGPMYIHAYWYAALEGRKRSEFVHQPHGQRPPPGAIVISSEQACTNCEMLRRDGDFLLYRVR